MNICIISGNLGADPESKYTQDGMLVVTFSLAFKSTKEKTGWIKIACFNKTAELAEKYLHKGAKIAVTGMLDQDKWTTDHGENKTSFKIIANSIEFIKTDGRGFDGGGADNRMNNNDYNEEDTPF